MPLLSPKVRSDLKYQADPKEEGRYYVKDPIRGEFFRYNELQVAMMRALDGKRTIAEVQALLAERFGAEVPAASINRFVDRLERAMLLDINTYRVNDAKTRAAILKALHKRGLALRVKARDGMSPEASLFESGVRQIHEGDPCLASSYLEAVLEVNPNNQRAQQILQCIQEAFFKTKIVVPSHVKMFHLWSPDRFLGAVDRRFGKFLFSGVGVALMVLFMLSSVYSAVEVMTRPQVLSGLGLGDLPLALVVFAFHIAFHELSHGLACKHHGGVVDDLGLLVMYGAIPGAYCDVSESYLFARRWHKIQVQLAGIFGHMVLQAGIWHLLNLTDPAFPLWAPMLVANLYVLYSNLQNLIPLAKFDGYYALAELLNLTNLRERSFTYVKDRLAVRLLGLPSKVGKVTPREHRIFLVYGVLACLFTTGLLYFLFISFLLPLAVDTLGTVGLVLAVLYIARQVVWRVAKSIVRLGVLVARERKTIFTRRRSLGFAFAAAILAFVLFLPWPLYVQGEMELEPHARARVRAAEPGLVAEVRVREGEQVRAGQVLAVLRGDELQRDRAFVTQELAVAQARLAILERGARAEELAVARAQTRVERAEYGLEAGRLRDMRKLAAANVVSSAALVTTAARASEAGGEAYVSAQETAVVASGARAEDITAQQATVHRLEALLQAIELRVARLELKSPIAGVVVTKRPEERLGRWVKLGDELLEVHDVSRWRIRIVPDRGEPLRALEVGQRVEVRAKGGPHELVEARLDAIAPPEDSENDVVLYASGDHAELRSGMTGLARIYVPSRSIGYRLVALPLIRIFDFDLWRMR